MTFDPGSQLDYPKGSKVTIIESILDEGVFKTADEESLNLYKKMTILSLVIANGKHNLIYFKTFLFRGEFFTRICNFTWRGVSDCEELVGQNKPTVNCEIYLVMSDSDCRVIV